VRPALANCRAGGRARAAVQSSPVTHDRSGLQKFAPPQHVCYSIFYSINSSARDSSVGGSVRPSAFAVFWLIRRSNLVG
jgi:hypothetical protein